jgi:hypothetical protein
VGQALPPVLLPAAGRAVYVSRLPLFSSFQLPHPRHIILTKFRCNSDQDWEITFAGGNGYNRALDVDAKQIPGYKNPVELPGAINAPVDKVTKKDTYMGGSKSPPQDVVNLVLRVYWGADLWVWCVRVSILSDGAEYDDMCESVR